MGFWILTWVVILMESVMNEVMTVVSGVNITVGCWWFLVYRPSR